MTFDSAAALHSLRCGVLLAAIAICGPIFSAPPEFPSDTGFPPANPDRQPGPAPLNPLPKELVKLIQDSTPLNPQRTVLLSLKHKRLFLHTQVSCADCVLEMLCCPEGQREHETILAVRSKSFVIHSGLLALGLEPGQPVEYVPDFKPPSGPEISITLHWVDKDGKLQKADARSWIRHSIYRYFARPLAAAPPDVELPHEELRYDPFNKELLWYGPMTTEQRKHLLSLWVDKNYQDVIEEFYKLSQSRPMEATFVFTGSRWDTDDVTRQRHYAADDGHLITVANFSSAMIDIAEASSSSDGGQSYEGWTERIPPRGTPVIVELAATDQGKRNRVRASAENSRDGGRSNSEEVPEQKSDETKPEETPQ